MVINTVLLGGSEKGVVVFGWEIRKNRGEVAFELYLEEKGRIQ